MPFRIATPACIDVSPLEIKKSGMATNFSSGLLILENILNYIP